MVTELQLTDPFSGTCPGCVLDLGVSRNESYSDIPLKFTTPVPIEGGSGLFLYERQLQFSYHSLRMKKGFSEIFRAKTWMLVNIFELPLMSSTNTYKNKTFFIRNFFDDF